MTIKEIEARCGMTRANIRFYESEGLLTPERKENGYREYSEDDLETLLRIRLLRSLRVPLDDIRALQSDEMELSAALREQLDALAAEQAELERSRSVCSEMLDDGAEYPSLDAQRYLDALSRETPAAVPEGDALPKLRAPWRRYLARAFDLMLYGALWCALLALACHVNIVAMSRGARILLSFAEALTMVFLEPLLLSCFGTTPGKWLLGLHVADNDGKRLFYSEALTRTVYVWGFGYGCNIPIFDLIRLYKSCRSCESGETLAWEYDSIETLRDDKTWRWAAFIAACAAVIGLAVTAVLVAELPKYRGDLTVAELCENYNRIVDYYVPESLFRLDSTGSWVKAAPNGAVLISFNDGPETPELVFTQKDGQVTGVSFSLTLDDAQFPPSYSEEAAYLTLAFAGAQKGCGLWRQAARDASNALLSQPYVNYTDEVYGVRIERRIDYAGYLDIGPNAPLLPVEDGAQTSYTVSFSMSKQQK